MTFPASTITGLLYVLTVPHLRCGRLSYNEDENNPSFEGGESDERVEGKLTTGRAITKNRRFTLPATDSQDSTTKGKNKERAYQEAISRCDRQASGAQAN
jgi:hypothetical protein